MVTREHVQRVTRNAWKLVEVELDNEGVFIDNPYDHVENVIEHISKNHQLHSLYFLNRLNTRDPQIVEWIREEFAK